MADVNANIRIDIDSSSALSNLRNLQTQISNFNKSVIASNTAAVAAQQQLNSQLINQIGAIKGFSTSITTVESSVSKLSRSIDKNKLSMGEYFRYGIGASRTFGRIFGKEHNEILAVAEDRVKRLNTQYVALGNSQNGMTKAMAIRPLQLFNAESAIGIQKQQLFNKLLRDGSTSLVNWGKNTQWAGRQLMVGFTVPVTMFGTIAGQVFMDLEKQIINFKRVYGDLGTTVEESEAMSKQVQALGKEYTKYGIAVKDTIGLAAKAAAAGVQGADLMAATEQSTRLATLGQIDQNQALEATISLQSAFRISSEELGQAIDFLNAVENQTVVSLEDMTIAIPKVAPVIKGLGGDVKDLAVFMAAMREGGVNAAEGANALKSGLASLINPTKNASEMLDRAGINMDALIEKNRGDLMGLVQDFAAELQNLDKFSRQQVLAKVFGKYQFARMGALFENINRDGSQAQRTLELTGASFQELNSLAEKELGNVENAVSTKFIGAVERLKLAIAPVGEMFLKIATPIVEMLTKIADKFNELPSSVQTFIVAGTAIGAVLIPSVIMLVGLLGNFLGNMMKIGVAFRSFMARIRGGGDAFNYYSNEELDALAASAALEGKVSSLTAEINIQRSAVMKLASAYGTMAAAARTAVANLPQGFRGRPVRRMASGGFVGGSGNKDSEPAMLMPGEFVVNKEATKKYAPVLMAMNEGKLKGFANGGSVGDIPQSRRMGLEYAHIADRVKLSIEQMQSMLDDFVAAGKGNAKAAKILKDSIQDQSEVFAYSNLGVPLRGDVNAQMGAIGATGASKSAFMGALAESGTGSAAGLIDILRQRGLITEPQMQGFADVFYSTFSQQMNNLDKQFIVDADMTQPFMVAARRAAQTLGSDFSEEAIRMINQESSAFTTIVSAQGQAHGGMGRATVPPEISGATTSYRSRGRGRRGLFGMLGGKMPSSAAAEMTTQAAKTVQQVQQSQSPSRITQELGEDFGAGYAEGIKSQSAKVNAAAGGLADRSIESMRSELASMPKEGQAARMSRIGSYGGDPRMIVNKVSQGNTAMEAEVARLRALQVEEKNILKRIIDMERGEIAQREIALKAAIRRKEQAERNATLGTAQANVQAATPMGAATMGGMPRVAAIPPMCGPGTPLNTSPLGGAAAGAADSVDNMSSKVGKADGVLKGFGTTLGKITPKVAGISMAATMAAGAFSGIEGPVGDAAQSLFPLLGVLDLLTIPLMFMGSGGGAASAAAGIGGVGSAAGGATGAMAGFGGAAASAALPITIIVAAIAALIALFVTAYKRSEELRNAISGVGSAFGELWQSISGIFGGGEKIVATFKSIGSVIGNVFNRVVGIAAALFTYLAKSVEITIKVITMLVGILRVAVKWIGEKISGAINWVLSETGAFGEKLKQIGEAIGNFFSAIPSTLVGLVNSGLGMLENFINGIIDLINKAITAYNALPGVDDIAYVESVSLKIAQEQGETPGRKGVSEEDIKYARDSGIAQALAARKPKKVKEEEDDGLLPEDVGGGEAEKSWLEQLIEDTNANYALFVGGMQKAKTSMLQKLKKQVPNMPEQLLEAIGEGPDALKNIKALLGMNVKKRNELIRKMIQTSASRTVQNALDAAAKAKREKSQAGQAEQILLNRGVAPELAKEIASNTDNAFSLVQAKAGKTKESLDTVMKALLGAAEASGEMDSAVSQMDWLNDLMEMQALQHNKEIKNIDDQIKTYKDKIEKIQEEIDALDKLNEKDKERIDDLQRQKELIGRQIDSLERANEMDQRRIDSLKREDELRNRAADSLSHELELMSEAETKIKNTYDARIKALDAIAQINDYILGQQQAQLGLSQALSQGDVYAAAQAAQEMQAQQMQFAAQQQRTALEQGMENEIASLATAGGLTRDQAEDQIRQIKEQSYQVSLQIRDIEDIIYQRNQEMIPLKDRQYNLDMQILGVQDTIYKREQSIKKIQDDRIAPLQSALDAQTKIKEQKQDEFDAQVESQKALLDQARLTDLQMSNTAKLGQNWRNVAQQIVNANNAMKNGILALGDAPVWNEASGEKYSDYEKRLAQYETKKNELVATRNKDVNNAIKSGQPVSAAMNAGGIVSGAGNRDSVLAALTPGEFVIRKAMVKKYGLSSLSAINQGSMPKYNLDDTRSSTAKGRLANINAPVYNSYSINVPVNQPGASADEIANKVMTRIRNIENGSIRRINGY